MAGGRLAAKKRGQENRPKADWGIRQRRRPPNLSLIDHAMRISAWVRNAGDGHELEVATNETARTFVIPAKPGGGGSAVNGGELLMLALATCFCNDIYREAARLGMVVTGVEVQASADFQGVGMAASNVSYRATVQSPEPADRIEQLLRETDAVAEIHNTVRSPVQVELLPWGSGS